MPGRNIAAVTAVLLAAGCQCGRDLTPIDGGGLPDASQLPDGGGADAGGCGTCPLGQVCDTALSRCVGGCPAGQGTCAAGCCPWESIDASVPQSMCGRKPVLLLDGEDRAFIVHRGYNANSFEALSTQNDGGAFDQEPIGFEGNSDWQNDQLVDPDGGRWIAFSQFHQNNTRDVTLFHQTGADYAFETLSDADFGTPASLGWSRGKPYVLWDRFGEETAIALSARDAPDGGWTTQPIAVPVRPSWAADLRFDASGTPHIAFGASGAMFGVFYGRGGADGGVAFEQVDGEVSVSRVSLELDMAGRPHLVYFLLSDGRLHYAVKDGAAWQKETVTSVGGDGWNPALVLDSAGQPHASFYRLDGGAAQYARRVGPGAWDVSIVDADPSAGSESDIALTRSGRPCIAYNVYTATYWGLRYACLP
jgi:hypothetical protein